MGSPYTRPSSCVALAQAAEIVSSASMVIVMAVFAPLLAPYSPIDQTLRDKLLPPAWMAGGSDKYFLGTDAFGRDILSRLIENMDS